MSATLCRVTVHSGGAGTDLTLPADMPVAELVPSIIDLLGGTAHGRHRLARLGCAPLPGSTTLAQNDIRDGAVLVLSRHDLQAPTPRCDDDAQVVAANLQPATDARTARRISAALAAVAITATGTLIVVRKAFDGTADADTTVLVAATAAVAALIAAALANRVLRESIGGLTLAIIATMFAAVAGLRAVPGVPGAPGVLLAAMAAAVTAVLAIRITYCNTTVLTAITGSAGIVALAALAVVVAEAPLHVVGSVTTLACLGLIEAAPRLSILLAGLSPSRVRGEDELAAKAPLADSWLTSLCTASASTAAIAVMVAALTAHRAILLAAVTGGLMLLHARADGRRALVFAASGIVTITATFAVAAMTWPGHEPWIAALAAILAFAATYLGFVAPALSLSPVTRRCVDALGCVALTAVVPLACWTCGAFGAVRSLRLQP